jgi:hypothetical protein
MGGSEGGVWVLGALEVSVAGGAFYWDGGNVRVSGRVVRCNT